MIFFDIKLHCGRFTIKAAVFLSFVFFTMTGCDSGNHQSSDEKMEKEPSKTDSTKSRPENQTTGLNDYSDITCPQCGFTKKEKLPTDFCLIKYACTKCQHEMVPDEGDCCVFCTYGTHKCPSMQE